MNAAIENTIMPMHRSITAALVLALTCIANEGQSQVRNPIYLNAETLDAASRSIRQPLKETSGKRLHLVQFSGPIQPEWVAALAADGLRVINYLPDYSYLVWGDRDALARTRGRAENSPDSGMVWDGDWRAEWTLAPSARSALASGLESKVPVPARYVVQLVDEPETNALTLSRLRTQGARLLGEPSAVDGLRNHLIEADVAAVLALSEAPGVVSIHRYIEPTLLDERQNMIVAGNVTGNVPNTGNYFDRLAAWGFNQAQFNASGLIVDVTDDGADINPAAGIGVNTYTGPVAPNHFVLYQDGARPIGLAAPTGTSRFVAKGRFGTAGSDAGLGNSGHGQLNMSIVGGYVPTGTVGGVNFAAAPHADASGFRYGLGVAPFVRMANSVIFDPAFTNPSYSTMLSANYLGGTRISSNSWGAAVAGAYDADAQAYDSLVRDSRAGEALNQQMTILFAAGNQGSGASTVGTPGTAKNVITVGASENVHPFGGADGCGTNDAGADSLNDMIAFSSRGPTTDQRVKPDIVAPGTHVTGMAFVTPTSTGTGTAVATFRADGVCGGVASSWFPSSQRWYTASSGTSHSTPAVAGGAALVYQQFLNNPAYLANQRTPASGPPSPALVKAYLMNTTRYLTGTGAGGNLPSNSQGMGLMDLGRSFDTTPRFIRDQVAADRFTASGQGRSFRAIISNNTRPVRITLAWTEPPGSTAGNSYVNNLDLLVLHNGSAYQGNVFTGANSTTGGSADVRNNVESVFLPAGISGTVTVLVRATNIAGQADPTVAGLNQDFSLVGYNLEQSSVCAATPTLLGGSVLSEGSIGSPYSHTLTASGTSAGYSYQLVSGSLPPGLALSGNTISGTPTTNGSFTASLAVIGAEGCGAIQTIQIGIGPANLTLGSRVVTTGNGSLQPQSCNNMNITLTNTGTRWARNVVGTLSSVATGVTVVQAQAAYPDIPPGGSAVNLTPYRISTSAAAVCGATAGLTLSTSYSGGASAPFNFNQAIGNDSYTFATSTGAILASSAANLVAGSAADDTVVSVTVPAGFNFNVYGTSVTGGSTLRVGTNGFLLLTASGGVDGSFSAATNSALPTTSLNDTVRVLMPFWDDLDLSTTATPNGGIYSVLTGSAPNRRWQLIWRGELFNAASTTETVRVAIEFSEGSNSFKYLYDLTGGNNGGGATVGVQQSLTGLFTQYSSNQSVVTAGLALQASAGCIAGSGGCASSVTTITGLTPSGIQTVGIPYNVNVSVTGTTATGTVTVNDGQGGRCVLTLPATSCALTSLAAGTLTLTADYSGDAVHPASSDTESVSVVNNNRGLQVGTVSVPATIAGANPLTRVNFNRAFNTVPVVIVMPSNDDADPQTLRIRNVTSTGFDLVQVEAPGCIGCTALGSSMPVHWLAAVPGSYSLSTSASTPFSFAGVRGGPGALVKVGTVSATGTAYNATAGFAGWPASGFQSVSFPSVPGFNFNAAPVVLTTLQTWNVLNEGSDLDLSVQPPLLTGTPEPWATVSVRNVTATGFEAAIDHSEVNDDDTGVLGLEQNEVLGYVAIANNVSVNLVTDSGTPVGLATGIGSANSACTNVDLPMPGTITPANLRGFAGMHSRTDADGGWLRRCSMADAGAGNARASLRVEEDEDFDGERSHGNESVGVAIFGNDFTTTPVSLARASVQRIDDQLDVRFETATEVGHLAYRIWGRGDANGEWRLLSDAWFAESSGDSLSRSAHQISVPAAGVQQIRIEDIDVLGRSRFHAAIPVGSETGAPVSQPSLDWQSIRASNAQALRAAAPSEQVLADVSQNGIQRITFEAMQAQGFQAPNALATTLAVLDDGRPVARHVQCPGATFGPGCSIEWWGTARDSLYGQRNTYVIAVKPDAAVPVSAGQAQYGSAQPYQFPEVLTFAPNRAYSFSAPGSDPWFDARIVANGAPATVERSFSLPGRASGPVVLSLTLWGGLDFAGDTPDHSVSVSVNGRLMSTRRFDGLTEQRLELVLAEDTLQTTNTVQIRVNADTGYPVDVVLLDGFQVRYSRFTRAVDGRLDARWPTTGTALLGNQGIVFADRFEAPQRFAVQGVQGTSVLWTQAGNKFGRDVIPSNQASQLQISSDVTALTLRPLDAVLQPVVRRAAPVLPSANGAEYLVIAPAMFVDALEPLLALQQSRGLSTQVITTEAIFAARSDHAPEPAAIAAEVAARKPRFLLLVGGDSVDYHDYLGLGSQSLIPTFYRAQDAIVRFAPSDLPFADRDSDGTPDLAIGRIPARTVSELALAITSVTERAQQSPQRFMAVAGGSDGGTSFAIHSRTLLSYLRQGQQRNYALVDEVGVAQARAKANAALSGGADWISYLGHSSPNRWGFDNVLDTQQLAGIARTGAPALVAQWGCWNNYFVAPNQDTMAHALMLRSNRLAAVVIGSSSLAEDSSHVALGTRFFDLVEDGKLGDSTHAPVTTVGEALSHAKRDLWQRSPEHRSAVYSVQLFGDPAQPLR